MVVVDDDAGGQGVDEDSGDVFGAGEIGGAAGDCCSEADVFLVAVARQQQCPGALDDGVEGESVVLGEVV